MGIEDLTAVQRTYLALTHAFHMAGWDEDMCFLEARSQLLLEHFEEVSQVTQLKNFLQDIKVRT